MIKLTKDKKSIDQLMQTYFSIVRDKDFEAALSSFKEKKGYGIEIIFVSFQGDLDDYDMAQLPKKLDEHHVLIELSSPAVEVDEIAYLSFETFCKYLEDHVKSYSNNQKLNSLLEEIKNKLLCS